MSADMCERLIASHAYWADRIRWLRNEGMEYAASCERRQAEAGAYWEDVAELMLNDTCIEAAYKEAGERVNPMYDEQVNFISVWHEMVKNGTACHACQQVRKLRGERIQAKRKLGGVRAAMTRVGRRLLEQEQSND